MAGVKGKSGRVEGNPGNKGGRPYSKDNREKAATLKGLVIDWMIDVMNGKDEKLKKEVSLKIATTCIPQEHRHSGSDENNLSIPILNVLPNNSNNKDNGNAEEDKSNSRRNECQQDYLNSDLPDSSGTTGQ